MGPSPQPDSTGHRLFLAGRRLTKSTAQVLWVAWHRLLFALKLFQRRASTAAARSDAGEPDHGYLDRGRKNSASCRIKCRYIRALFGRTVIQTRRIGRVSSRGKRSPDQDTGKEIRTPPQRIISRHARGDDWSQSILPQARNSFGISPRPPPVPKFAAPIRTAVWIRHRLSVARTGKDHRHRPPAFCCWRGNMAFDVVGGFVPHDKGEARPRSRHPPISARVKAITDAPPFCLSSSDRRCRLARTVALPNLLKSPLTCERCASDIRVPRQGFDGSQTRG